MRARDKWETLAEYESPAEDPSPRPSPSGGQGEVRFPSPPAGEGEGKGEGSWHDDATSRRLSQYESELITSPRFGVESADQVALLTLDLMNLTEPSAIAVFTPPGCRELAEMTLRAEE